MVTGVLAPTSDALALWGDRLEVFAAESFTQDDNIFRLASGVDPVTTLGSPSKGDTYRTTSLGARFDIPMSAQRFVGDVTLSSYHFDRFSTLDLDGHEGRAEWLWQIGDELGGQLGYTERYALASLANVQSGVQSSTPNFLKVQRTFLNATYGLGTRWQIGADVSRLEHSNSATEFQLSDVSSDIAELTVAYVTPAESRLGVSARVADGRLPNQQLLAGVGIDNSYRQQSIAAFIEWTMTAHSRMSARAGPISRSHAQLPERDFESWMFHAAYEWKPTDKLTLTAAAQRDISATEQIYVGFVLVKGVALYSRLALNDKVQLSMNLDYSDRNYLGDPGQVLGTVPPRSERVHFAGLTVSYRPTPILTLDFALRRETRSSAVAFANYQVGVASFGARIAF